MSEFNVTVFAGLHAATMQAMGAPDFKAFCDSLMHPEEYPAKADMPLFCPMLFDGSKSENGALRHNGGVTLIYGACGDHDSGSMTLKEAANRLKAAGVEAFLYSTPSSTPDIPRWRVVAPFSKASSVAHDHLVAVEKLNHILDGTLKTESFTLSQSFYFGRVAGKPYETAYVEGGYIDLMYLPRRAKANGEAAGGNGGGSGERIDDEVLFRQIIEGIEFHPAMVQLSARLAGRGHSAEEIERQLSSLVKATRCDELERVHARLKEIPRIVTSAMAKFGLPPLAQRKARQTPQEGSGEAGEAPAAPKAGPEDWDALTARIRGWAPLDRSKVVPVSFYIDGLLEEERSAGLVAPGGTGKTTLLLDLAIATALGKPWLGMDVKQGGFVLLSLDDMQHDLDGALDALLADRTLTKAEIKQVLTNVRLISLTGLRDTIAFAVEGDRGVSATDIEEVLVEALADVPDLRCVVLDTLRQFSGGDTNNSRVMTIATKAVTGMAERLGCCTIVPHHMTKLGARAGEADQYVGSGSAAFGDNLRVILVLQATTVAEMAEAIKLTPLEEASCSMSQVLRLTDTRGSLRRRTLDPIWLARDGYTIRRLTGVTLSVQEREDAMLQRVVEAVRAGATSGTAVRQMLKTSQAKAGVLIQAALAKGLIAKGPGRGDPLKVS